LAVPVAKPWEGILHKLIYLVSILATAAGIAWFYGPRVEANTVTDFDAASIGSDPQAYLAESEAKVSGIHDDLQKEIIWAYPASKAKTPLAIVYVHGFSASKNETRPVPDMAAQALGANLYLTRLTGHGINGNALAGATVNDWAHDMAEALAVGKMIGEKVIVVGVSTGAGLATWAASDAAMTNDIAGLVFISPNYGVQAGGAWLLTMPFGEQLANVIVGSERVFETHNDMHKRFWTSSYPTKALLPMAALTKLAAETVVENIPQPVLMIYSETDTVIRPDLVKSVAERWGGKAELYALPRNDDPSSHVIAGDALSPSTNKEVADKIVEWVKAQGF
jgi:pimeloyl-ACP methyl ester carboxylesterase